jgi:C4-type Zn-finger protein
VKATARPDNCGECVIAERSVTATPYLTEPQFPEAIRAYYRCRECGYRWTTTFLASALDDEMDGAA